MSRLSTLVALLASLLGPLSACASDDAPRGMRVPPERVSDAEPEADRAALELAEAGLAPRPYTWQQIRDAMPQGFTTRYRVEVAGRPPLVTVSRVKSWGPERVTLWQQQLDLDGKPLADAQESEQAWSDLRDHATFALADTTITDAVLTTPAGTFDCALYTVITRAEGRNVESRYHFARNKPGAPVRYERVEDGRRAMLMELLAYGPSEGGGPPRDARELLARVQGAAAFPTSIRFTQDVTSHRPDGTTSETSMEEWALVPGRLRIDVTEPEPASVLFSDERVLRVSASGVSERAGPSMPMLLMIDVLAQQPDAWLERAAAHGVDIAVLSTQTWEGRPHVVLGAAEGDLDETQVWFDADTWLPARYLETTGTGDTTRRTDGRALDYREFDGRLFHTRFEFWVDGRLALEERYRDVVLDAELPPGTFDAAQVAARFIDG